MLFDGDAQGSSAKGKPDGPTAPIDPLGVMNQPPDDVHNPAAKVYLAFSINNLEHVSNISQLPTKSQPCGQRSVDFALFCRLLSAWRNP